MKLKQTQQELLLMIKKVDEIFQENNLKYMLLAGSVLGAIRHKGFIPWDDDIDIGVLRSDFERAESLLCTIKEFSYEPIENHIVPEAPIGKLRFPKENEERKNWTALDVFVIDSLPNNTKAKKKLFNAANWYHLAILGRPSLNRGLIKKIITWSLLHFIPKFIWTKIQKKSLSIITKYENNKTELLGVVLGAWNDKEIFQRSIYENTIFVPFEDTKLPIPSDYDTYLTQMYGDYMIPPPIEYRYSDHTSKRKY